VGIGSLGKGDMILPTWKFVGIAAENFSTYVEICGLWTAEDSTQFLWYHQL